MSGTVVNTMDGVVQMSVQTEKEKYGSTLANSGSKATQMEK